MTEWDSDSGHTLVERGSNLRRAVAELVDQEFEYSTGHLTAILNTCLFAPSLLTFWLVNGILDFSTAVAIGAVTSPAGLQVRLVAYLLLVPVFLLTRVIIHLLHPTHRAQILAGSCPNTRLMSLDWFSMGILATGLPLAIQRLGPWLALNGTILLGVFVLPRFAPARLAGSIKIGAIGVAIALFLYASYGAVVPRVPHPASVLGPLATLTLTESTTGWLVRAFNSALVGPLLVGVFGVAMNILLTRPELTTIPLLHHSLPSRDPALVVATNAAAGTLFYLLVVGGTTGQLFLVP
ncbi:hypothetical protein [Halomicrobium katesii]|uniref:hypothetical protein n=1 Tax=Halomicrobium katesii TaxID=437163 RepID=UPI0003801A1F|nr:hypothetical protein [Halomicrobium katesii]